MTDDIAAEKARLRGFIAAERRALTPEEAARRSDLAQRRLLASPLWGRARSLALYVAAKGELGTELLLRQAWAQGKSVFLPKVESRPESPLSGVKPSGRASPGRMAFAPCAGLEQLRPGAFNIPEPAAEACARDLSPNRSCGWPPALFVLPGLAFDHRGRRLGWGGGYYDSFLAGPAAPAECPAQPGHAGRIEDDLRFAHAPSAGCAVQTGCASPAGCGVTLIGLAYSFQLLEEIPALEWDVAVNVICTDEELLWIT